VSKFRAFPPPPPQARPHRSWSSPWTAITGPLSPFFLHSLGFSVGPRSSYRASLRQRWPDFVGAPSCSSAVRHARGWQYFRAPPVKLMVPWCAGGRREDHDSDLAAGGLAVDERWPCKAAPCSALYDVRGPHVGVPLSRLRLSQRAGPSRALGRAACWAEPRARPSG
jgi:hypothetical protein